MDLIASEFNMKLDKFISKDPRVDIVDALVVLNAFPLLKQ